MGEGGGWKECEARVHVVRGSGKMTINVRVRVWVTVKVSVRLKARARVRVSVRIEDDAGLRLTGILSVSVRVE